MSRQRLIDLYASSPAGMIPDGPARGIALVLPGMLLNSFFAAWTNLVGWQGKTFDAAHGRLVNRITPFRVNAIAAQVYFGPSMLDDKPCIVLDYSKTSTIARFVRDEIRNVAPRLYLGFAYCRRVRTIAFGLDFTRVR
ncbi:MAG TPA: hypothetical protein VKR05_05620 [Candidatus Cybelea sp.]|nr:hypothetical protein [Candidatus Cybelea sp.]